jgi:hypothetical protein
MLNINLSVGPALPLIYINQRVPSETALTSSICIDHPGRQHVHFDHERLAWHPNRADLLLDLKRWRHEHRILIQL